MKKCLLLLNASLFFLAAQSQSWSLTGNAGTNSNVNFIGTTDNVALRLRVNNNYAGEINFSNGKTCLGYGAGQGGPGTYSVAIGYRALNSNPAYENIAIGAYALERNTGSYNSAVGYGSMQLNSSGGSNTAMGYGSLGSNTTGYYNTAFGRDALRSNNGSLGSYNTAVGVSALFRTTNSQYNTCVGYNAGDSYDMGYNNTIIGANCDVSFAGQYNAVAIGQGVICPDNSTARIGNAATWSIGGYANWSNISDGRFKKEVKEDVKGIDFIMKLHPVTYHLDIAGISRHLKENNGKEWNAQMKTAMDEKEKIVFSGFVAQDVEQAAKETGYDFSGVDKPKKEDGLYSLRYADFVVPLVKAVQEQQQMIDELKKQNADLQKRLTDLENRVTNTYTIHKQ